jgi:hypothetical protein
LKLILIRSLAKSDCLVIKAIITTVFNVKTAKDETNFGSGWMVLTFKELNKLLETNVFVVLLRPNLYNDLFVLKGIVHDLLKIVCHSTENLFTVLLVMKPLIDHF